MSEVDKVLAEYLAERPTREISQAIKSIGTPQERLAKMVEALIEWAGWCLWINASALQDLALYSKQYNWGKSLAVMIELKIENRTPTTEQVFYHVLQIADKAREENEKLKKEAEESSKQIGRFQEFCGEQTSHNFVDLKDSHFTFDDDNNMQEHETHQCDNCGKIKYIEVT